MQRCRRLICYAVALTRDSVASVACRILLSNLGAALRKLKLGSTGFPKLANFLATIDELELQSDGQTCGAIWCTMRENRPPGKASHQPAGESASRATEAMPSNAVVVYLTAGSSKSQAAAISKFPAWTGFADLRVVGVVRRCAPGVSISSLSEQLRSTFGCDKTVKLFRLSKSVFLRTVLFSAAAAFGGFALFSACCSLTPRAYFLQVLALFPRRIPGGGTSSRAWR